VGWDGLGWGDTFCIFRSLFYELSELFSYRSDYVLLENGLSQETFGGFRGDKVRRERGRGERVGWDEIRWDGMG